MNNVPPAHIRQYIRQLSINRTCGAKKAPRTKLSGEKSGRLPATCDHRHQFIVLTNVFDTVQRNPFSHRVGRHLLQQLIDISIGQITAVGQLELVDGVTGAVKMVADGNQVVSAVSDLQVITVAEKRNGVG